MENALLYAVLFLVVLPSAIGALVLAWLHKLGFRWVLKTSKDDTPGFFKRYSIQLLYLLIISAASYFYYQHAASEITSGKIPVPLFPATEMGLFAAVITYLIFSLVVYGLVVAGLTKLFTAFTFSESLKSQTVSLAVVALLSFGALGFFYKALNPDALQLTNLNDAELVVSAVEDSENDKPSANENATQELNSRLAGFWITKGRLHLAEDSVTEKEEWLRNCSSRNFETDYFSSDAEAYGSPGSFQWYEGGCGYSNVTKGEDENLFIADLSCGQEGENWEDRGSFSFSTDGENSDNVDQYMTLSFENGEGGTEFLKCSTGRID